MQTERITLNDAELAEARGWLADCFGHDWNFDADELDALEVEFAIVRYYDGGLAAFVVASGMR